MAAYDSADLLALGNAYTGRPVTGDSITDAQKYARLSKSQNRIIAMMAPVCPNSLYPHVAYGSLPTLTTTDNQVYTFGTDAQGYAKFPMGHGGIFQSLNDIPNFPLRPGVDYLIEGTQVRALNNGTLPAVLYWYGIGNPPDIDATHQPSLFPEASRELIAFDYAYQFAMEGNRNPDLAAQMQANIYGNAPAGIVGAWPRWCLVWKTQFATGGALNCFTGRDLAIAGGANTYGYYY